MEVAIEYLHIRLKKGFTNKELIKGCIQKNRVHQEALYRKFCPQMIHLGYRFTKDQDLIISWVNNGFLKVYTKIEQLRGQSGEQLGGWIRTIVYRTMIDGVRKEKKYWNQIVMNGEDYHHGMNHQIHNFEYDELLDIIELLPSKSKQVFHLFALQGYKHEEIGSMLGISEGTSKWHLHQARKEIQEKLEIRKKRELYG